MSLNKENKTVLLKFKNISGVFLLVVGGIVQLCKCNPPPRGYTQGVHGDRNKRNISIQSGFKMKDI